MTDEKLMRIVDKLRQKTLYREVNWDYTADEDTFSLSLTNSSITVNRIEYRDSDGYNMDSAYNITFLNEQGRIIETVHISSPPHLEVLGELYELARKSALKVDQVLDNILCELDK